MGLSQSPVYSTPLPSTASLNATSVAFYWIQAETPGEVTVTCTLSSGAKLKASAQYEVIAPTSKATASYGTFRTNKNYGIDPPTCSLSSTDVLLHFGNPCTTSGIKWQYTATANEQEGGKLVMFQTINRNVTWTNTDGSTGGDTTKGESCTDNGVEFSSPAPLPKSTTGTWSFFDAPAVDLFGNVKAEMQDIYDDYFMYKPNDVGLSPSIWVTLDHMTWSYDVLTSLSAGSWTDPPTEKSPSVLPTLAGSYTALPIWKCSYVNKKS